MLSAEMKSYGATTDLPVSHSEEEPKSNKRLAILVITAMAMLVSGAAALNGSSAKAAVKSKGGAAPSLMEQVALEKPNYGAMSASDVAKLFDEFMAQHAKPYASDAAAKAVRFDQFKANLKEIDALNVQHPMALYRANVRADWTAEERAEMRGLKSAAESKLPGETRSSLEIMKAAYPKPSDIALGEKGPAEVAAAKAAGADPAQDGRRLKVDGVEMSVGEVGWATEGDCAACKAFPHFANYSLDNLPDFFDWRELGAVGPVLNQKYCGSCWTFSTAQDLSGVHYLATGNLLELSEQQLVACNTANYGCDGGYPFIAMQYVEQIGGMLTDESYPYKGICAWDACGEFPDGEVAGTPTCDTALLTEELEAKNVAAVGGYQMVAMGAEYEALTAAVLVKNGPLSVAFNAEGMDYYVHGIAGPTQCVNAETGYIEAGCISEYDKCNPDYLDHAVLLVGYGTQDGVDYWVLKNSWAEEWGDGGYYRLLKGSNACGVVSFISHAVVKEA